jgi:hypothetical protein
MSNTWINVTGWMDLGGIVFLPPLSNSNYDFTFYFSIFILVFRFQNKAEVYPYSVTGY